MATASIKIQSILNGVSSTEYLGSKSSYKAALGVDPDVAINGNKKSSGILVPRAFSNFNGSNVDATPKWMIPNPVDKYLYGTSSDGIFWRYNQELNAYAALGDTNNGKRNNTGRGQGLAYYNNYIYIASDRDVARYGPLDGEHTPSFDNSYWQDTLGFNDYDVDTLDTDESFPRLRAGRFPSHGMYEHGDGALYICDKTQGFGCLSKVETNSSKEFGDEIVGERNDGSAKDVIDFPQGFAPTCMTGFDTFIVVGCVQIVDDPRYDTTADFATKYTDNPAALFVWDPTDTVSFFRGPLFMTDPLITAMKTINGIVYIWSGSPNGGCRLSTYAGGNSIVELSYVEDGQPPFPGAVGYIDNRILWGSYADDISPSACIWAWGTRDKSLPKGIHNIGRLSGSSVSSVSSLVTFKDRLLAGWTESPDDTTDLPAGNVGIDREIAGTSIYNSVWRSETFNVNSDFVLHEIKLPFAKAVAANMELTPKIYLDDASSSVTLEQINNTTCSGERRRTYKTPELVECRGQNNFYLELTWTGTAQLPVGLPIEIRVDVHGDTKSV